MRRVPCSSGSGAGAGTRRPRRSSPSWRSSSRTRGPPIRARSPSRPRSTRTGHSREWPSTGATRGRAAARDSRSRSSSSRESRRSRFARAGRRALALHRARRRRAHPRDARLRRGHARVDELRRVLAHDHVEQPHRRHPGGPGGIGTADRGSRHDPRERRGADRLRGGGDAHVPRRGPGGRRAVRFATITRRRTSSSRWCPSPPRTWSLTTSRCSSSRASSSSRSRPTRSAAVGISSGRSASRRISTIVSPETVWYVQVGALVVGHVAGLAIAHDRAVSIFEDRRAALRSQYPMLALMVLYTVGGLWLLSRG